MTADQVVSTLKDLVQEQNADVKLLAALSRRYYGHAEEFFPPQIEDVLGSFASLAYADEHLLKGLEGRIEDLSSDASPRRVVRVLRAGASLRLDPEAWLPHMLSALHRHMPNMREGIPSVLAHLHALRRHDPEVLELLLTQGFIVSEELGDAFLARVLEAWSRYGLKDEEVRDRSEALAEQIIDSTSELAHDVRDGLNVLACLVRSPAPSRQAAALEEHLAECLRRASYKEASATLQWMKRLSLRSAPLWKACADAAEIALKDKNFVRDHFAEVVHGLAAISDTADKDEVALLSGLFASQEVRRLGRRFDAAKTLRVLHAGSLAGLGDSLLAPWAEQAARLSRQLCLADRRTLRTISDARTKVSALLSETMQQTPVVPLPPLMDPASSSGMVSVPVGAEAILQGKERGGMPSGIRFLGFEDTLAGMQREEPPVSPSCQLSLRAMKAQGWHVTLQS